MTKYIVYLPIAGYVGVEVKAESEKEAIGKALKEEWEYDDILEIDAYEKIVEGNICHLSHNRASVRRLDDED